MQIVIEKPQIQVSNLYQIKKSNEVGVLGAETENRVCLYIIGSHSFGKAIWCFRSEVEQIPIGSKVLIHL